MSRLGILFVLIIFVFAATLTFAKNENSNSGRGNSESSKIEVKDDNAVEVEKNGDNRGQGSHKLELTSTDSALNRGQAKKLEEQPSATCAPEGMWKNHGDYVSCVAKLHQGGKAVSEAAHSDIGKKNATSSASMAPSASASASASLEPSPLATDSGTPEATDSAGTDETILTTVVESVFGSVKNFFEQLQALFSL